MGEMLFYHPVIEDAVQETLGDLHAELCKPVPVEPHVFSRPQSRTESSLTCTSGDSKKPGELP